MSKKRKREPEPAMLTLAGIYEKLAEESEDQRLQAAQSLLKDFAPKSTSIEQIKIIITRLFRGLCSSRKAARLGFSVALTEYLVELQVQRGGSITSGVPTSNILDILDNETTLEGSNSGQDERDHYFGRLFGAEAVIKSNILVKQQDLVQWKRLLDLICDIANKKPWLKQECGWILYSCIKAFASNETDVPDDFALDVVEKLTVHKLIRTPEGLAIWLEVSESFPDAKLPKHVWKHRDPLAKKEISLLADVLKDAKSRENSDDEEHRSQGKAIWSAQLHFAWGVVLSRLYTLPAFPTNGKASGTHQKDHKSIDLGIFWDKAVDESLFAPTSSPERKHWGLLLLSKVLTEAPEPMLHEVFSKNAMNCLINTLKGEDRYLQRTAQKAIQSLQKRAEADPEAASTLFNNLLRGTNFVDFDKLTKTKTVEKLMAATAELAQHNLVTILRSCFIYPGTDDAKDASMWRRQVIALQGKLFGQHLSQALGTDWQSLRELPASQQILLAWVDAGYIIEPAEEPTLSKELRDMARSRLSNHLEQALKAGTTGKRMLHDVIVKLLSSYQQVPARIVVDFDESVRSIILRGSEMLQSLPFSWVGSTTTANSAKDTPFTEGLLMLYCLTIFQVFNGEAEAVEILEDLLTYHEELHAKSKRPQLDNAENQSDTLIEILLSFASKPSRFLRRLTNIVFEGIAPQVTSNGLKSLTRVLATKENVEGQEEIFDAADEDVNTQDEDDSDASDVEMVDSDIEVISASSDSTTDAEKSDEGSDEAVSENDEDEELAAFDLKLAAALGTRKLPNGVVDDDASSTSGASDTDMDDEQMMVLDDKLAEVFRARQQETNKKREKKDAKETIVNFKNRVLDLIEVYLKVEYLSSQSLELLVPLLHLARKSKTKQLADRACTVLNEFCKRCKGVNVPGRSDGIEGLDLLRTLHVEAGSGASNAHANAASHASILVCKSLVSSGVKIGEVVDVYAQTQKSMLSDRKCKVQAGLFTDWNNWCISVRERFAE